MDVKPVNYCVVDAFADSAFKGNPAAVCLLEEDKDEEWLQAVAREFNQPITCYLARLPGSAGSPTSSVPRFCIRWFTTVVEVKLCGHATLAASHFLFSRKLVKSDVVEFLSSHSGILTAKRIAATKMSSDPVPESNGSFIIELDFPAFSVNEFEGPIDISSVSKSVNGASVIDILASSADMLVFVLPSGEEVAKFVPNFDEIQKFPSRGIIVTGIAPAGSGFDIISRFFSPKEGIDEDQVCGSAHCAIAPYWSKKLGKCDLVAYQASRRGGVLNLYVDMKNQRVFIKGRGVAVMDGSILV